LSIFSNASVSSSPLIEPRVGFGVFSSDIAGQELRQTTTVIKSKGTKYGWVVALHPSKEVVNKEVDIVEILDLPSAPLIWVLPGKSSISNEGRHVESSSKGRISKSGLLFNTLSFLPGDPVGRWHLTVLVDNHKIGDFYYDVVDGPPIQEVEVPLI
jgi:hypothetical protein